MGLVFTTSEFVIISQGKGRNQEKSGSFLSREIQRTFIRDRVGAELI